MIEQPVAVYCFRDNLLTATRPAWARPGDLRRWWLDAQVLTTAVVAARFHKRIQAVTAHVFVFKMVLFVFVRSPNKPASSLRHWSSNDGI